MCIRDSLYIRQGGDGVGFLADDFGVEGAVDQDGLADLLGFLGIQEIAASGRELFFDGGIHLLVHNDRLLRGADHPVVEGFGVDDGVDGQQDVSRFIDNGRGVAGAHAQGGLAGGIGRLDHAGAAGREDDVGLLHDRVGQLQGGHVDPGDDVLGCAGRHRRLQDHTGRLDGTLLGTGLSLIHI